MYPNSCSTQTTGLLFTTKIFMNKVLILKKIWTKSFVWHQFPGPQYAKFEIHQDVKQCTTPFFVIPSGWGFFHQCSDWQMFALNVELIEVRLKTWEFQLEKTLNRVFRSLKPHFRQGFPVNNFKLAHALPSIVLKAWKRNKFVNICIHFWFELIQILKFQNNWSFISGIMVYMSHNFFWRFMGNFDVALRFKFWISAVVFCHSLI